MNWKLVATLIVGAVLVSACGAPPQEAASPTNETRGVKEDPAPGAGSGTVAPATTAPDVQPANKPTDPAGLKKDIVVHDAAKP